ncbi:MAG: tRNA uridine-5-carboxymethylaminomethyl(34) synthesis GTPase MnmE [Gammaproteobacteria bacterium]|nr:tRNA uridine-5-carboxymethylaminomethyl(34) synthesis GTPase MnmE [Gammaproteobacteria bacterium]
MTIYALSTVEGQSGVAIIRVSGHLSKKTIKTLTGKELKPRLITLAKIRTLNNKIIDEGLVVYFPKKHSFTGEEVAEFHIHGSTAIIEKLLKELGKIKGLRPAKQGEFTKQAYLNGKMNLLQVEGLSSLIQAETEAQREKALETYLDENSKIHFSWLQELKNALAYIESSIDFSEEDIPASLLNSAKKLIKKTVNKIKNYEKSFEDKKRMKEGLKIVILGIPNSGKSTLINYLSGKKIAIVSKKAGTTRDILNQKLNIKGIPVTFYDTAGLRKSKNDIEVEGNIRAEKVAKEADIKIYLGSNNIKKPFGNIKVDKNKNNLVVINKSDLKKKHNEKPNITISLKNNKSLDTLWKKINQKIKSLVNTSSGPTISSEREYAHIIKSIAILENINFNDVSLAAEDVRAAINEISEITKKTYNEDILDIIFNEFCIGK